MKVQRVNNKINGSTDKNRDIEESELSYALEILQLEDITSPEKVQKSFGRLTNLYHPDKSTESREKYLQVLRAYEVLVKILEKRNAGTDVKNSPHPEKVQKLHQGVPCVSKVAQSLGPSGETRIEPPVEGIALDQGKLSTNPVPKNPYTPTPEKGTPSFRDNSGANEFQGKLLVVPTYLGKSEAPLQYTVYIDWFNVLQSWYQNQSYIKHFRYVYTVPCDCQEICNFCMGRGTLSKQPCDSCRGKGQVHYCEECSKTGLKANKETIKLVIDQFHTPKAREVYNQKGNYWSHNREELVLNFKSTGPISRVKQNVFILTKWIRAEDLGPALSINYFNGQCINMDSTKIRRIPYYMALPSFNLKINRKPIKVYLRMKLDLEQK